MRLYSHPKLVVGGAERQMELIAKQLIKHKDIDVHFITNRFTKKQKKFQIIDGLKVITIGKIKKRRKSKGLLNKFFSYIDSLDVNIFFKYLCSFNYDIYHLRGQNAFTGIWAFFAKYLKRKSFVFTAASIGCCIPGSLQWSFLSNLIYKFAIRKADKVVVLANYMKREMDKNFGVNSVIIKSGHPVPEDNFKKNEPPIILWISTLQELKRAELFLRLAEKLADLEAHFLLIGPGEYDKERIVKFANSHDNFIYIPGVKSGDDKKYYADASLLINTSRSEGFPNSFIQAWLYKTPVISLDVDPDSIIKNNGLGYYAAGNFKKLVEKVRDLINNKTELEIIGEKCRKYAILNHNIENTSLEYLRVYNSLEK